MLESIKTVYSGGVGEIVIKKSKFISTVFPIKEEEEAIELIEGLKKKYWDASHNCSAFIVGTKNPVMRCSDDGEPSKTAGRPILDVLISHQLTDLLVVVTRYFGGTLLGTGGLVKAYQSATLEGLNRSVIIDKMLGIKIQITTDYNLIGKIQYFINQENITLLSTDYTDIVQLKVLVPPSSKDFFIKKVAELTNGSATLMIDEYAYFTKLEGEIIML